jgi:hypothetical protein
VLLCSIVCVLLGIVTGMVAGSRDVQRLAELYRILVDVDRQPWTSPSSGTRNLIFRPVDMRRHPWQIGHIEHRIEPRYDGNVPVHLFRPAHANVSSMHTAIGEDELQSWNHVNFSD